MQCPEKSILALSTFLKNKSDQIKMSSTTRNVRGVRVFGSRPGLRRHIWTAGELQELCRAYMEHSRHMPMWKIAEMLHTTFSYPKHDILEDEDYVPPRRAPGYAFVPSIQAIISKLMNCVYLETGGELGYMTTKPSELQTQAWEHLLQSRQHYAMIQAMKSSSSSEPAIAISVAPSTPIKTEQEEADFALRVAPGAPVKPKSRTSIGRVRVRDSDDEEWESAHPPKRRKIIFDDDDEVASDTPTEMQIHTPTAQTSAIQFHEVSDAISEIEQEISRDNIPENATADMMESDDDEDNCYNTYYAQHLQQQSEQQQETHASIMASLNRISTYEQQIGAMSSWISGFQEEIEAIRRAIAQEVAILNAMLNPQEIANDADDMQDCEEEQEQEQEQARDDGMYNVDGYQVSSWIYNDDYDEPVRGGGGYDHQEECS